MAGGTQFFEILSDSFAAPTSVRGDPTDSGTVTRLAVKPVEKFDHGISVVDWHWWNPFAICVSTLRFAKCVMLFDFASRLCSPQELSCWVLCVPLTAETPLTL